jgi:imidazolonepropionase-like amidohydrolase
MLRHMRRTLLSGGVVLDVRTGGTSVADVVVEGDRIVDVGAGIDGDDSVNCGGQLIVPGFIDCHTHVALAAEFAGPDPMEMPRSVRVLSAVPVLTTLLRRAAEEAARCGARSIEHGIFLDEAAAAAMSAAGTWLVPTLSCTQGDLGRLPETVAAAHRASVRLALDAGVPIAMGTDNPVRPHAEVLNELRYLSQAGLGDAVALRAATFEAARLLGLADDRGEIAPQKRAGLVLLAGTDLDVSDLASRVRRVWHNGMAVAAAAVDQ